MASPAQAGTTVQAPPASATIRANAAAATAVGNSGQAKCDFCARVGLPILPLRYAVVPSYLPGAVTNPVGWSHLGESLKGAPPEGLKTHRYALRTLRKGYVMIYFGSGLWHGYVVSAGGHLRKLADIDDPDFKNDREMSAQCVRAGHNIPASFITIPPLPHGEVRMIPTKVWIAFSDVLWTREVRQQYERHARGARAMRGARFQAFMTDSLGKQADSLSDAFQLSPNEEATAERLNTLVVEYAADAAQAASRTHYEATDPYDPKKRKNTLWESVHGMSMRTGEAAAVAKHATKLTTSYHDKLMASAVVLDDPVGIVQELNATRLKVVESRQRYLSDPRVARPLLISQSIMGLKAMIGEQALASVTEQEKGKPDVQTETVYTLDGMPVYTETTTRKERAESKAGSLWSSLQQHYRESERAAFEKKAAAAVKTFQEMLVKTDADYAHWLGQPEWVLRCRDFDPRVPEQQDRLHEVMAAALRGGPTGSPAPSSAPSQEPQDSRVYEVWQKFFSLPPTDEANPIYAALFGFDRGYLDYLMPEGVNPIEDKLEKGNRLYKVIKTVIGTGDLTNDTWSGFKNGGVSGMLTRQAANKVPNPVRVAGAGAMNALRTNRVTTATKAVAESMLAMGGALNRMAANAVTEVGQATVLRAVQGAVLLYERREIYLVTSRIRVREYVAYLNDIAFKATDSALLDAAKSIKNVAQAGKNTVRSMAIAGVLQISDKKVADAFIEVTHWVYDDLDKLTKAIDALPAERQAAGARREAAQAATAAEHAAMAAAMRVHPFTLSPRATKFVDTVLERANSAHVGTLSTLRVMTRTTLGLATTGTGILAVGSLVVLGWLLKDAVKKADAKFLGNNEARVLVASASVAVFSAAVEVVWVSGKLLGARWATARFSFGWGAVFGAVSSLLDGIWAFMVGARAGSHGDNDARNLYYAAGVAWVLSGGIGLWGSATGAALLGPIGWALILMAIGVTLVYFAMKAEDSQAAIWLDRCYWGKGSRFKNSRIPVARPNPQRQRHASYTRIENSRNPVERPWTDREIDRELSHLNAIIIGLSGETGFNDDGWGITDWVWDTVKAKVTFPNFDAKASAFDWKLRAVNPSKLLNVTLASGKHQTVPDDPNAIVVRAVAPKQAAINPSEYFRNLVQTSRREGQKNEVLVVEVSVEVRVKYFTDVELAAEYVADLSDPRGRASLALNEKD